MGKQKIIDAEGLLYTIISLGFILTFSEAFKTFVSSILGKYENVVTLFMGYGIVSVAMVTIIIFMLYMISGYVKAKFK